MVQFNSENLSYEQSYKLLTGSIVPRPIAWVTTLSATGQVNAAPFSAFTFVSTLPPMVAVCIGEKSGRTKDTALNILRERELVINIADIPLVEKLHESSYPYAHEVSEVTALGLDVEPSNCRTPRLKDVPISLECTLHDSYEFGDVPSVLFVARVRYFHVRDSIVQDGKIDTIRLNPVARIAGPSYASVRSHCTLQPYSGPAVPEDKAAPEASADRRG